MKANQYIDSKVSKVVTLLATSTLLVFSFQNWNGPQFDREERPAMGRRP